MLTVDALHACGANTQEGLGRCMNNEAFYIRLVNMALDDASFQKLSDAVAAGDKKAGFEAAHSLKGVLGNLALTPIYAPVAEMTELLRAAADTDYQSYLDRILAARDQMIALR